MRCVRWWLRRWRPDLVPHGAALGASGPSPGRTTHRQLVVARSGAGSLHGPRWGRQVPAALVPAALAAASHGEAEHQDEQDRGDDEQDAPHGPPPCPYLHLCAGEPGAPQALPGIRLRQQTLALPGAMAQPLGPFLERSGGPEGSASYSSGGRAVALCRALCPSSYTGSLQSWINPDDQVHHAPAE